jgi:hypothetical protein
MASDFVQVTLPTDNIVFHEGRGQYIVKCMTIPRDFTGVQLTSAISGIVTGVHSWYQGELQWYVNAKGQLCSADGTFRLGRHGAIMKSKSSELLNYGDEFGNIVEGAALTDGSVIAKKLSDSSKLATTTCVFSSPDYNTVAWTAGVLVLADGTSFSIQAGNTGDMTGMTYIYFDRAISQTQFQLAYDMTSIASDGAILVCDAKQASSNDLLAHFVSINGYMLLNVNQLNVNYLSALSANLGTVTTGLLQMGQATSFAAGAGVWVYGQGAVSQFRVGNPATNKTISFDSATGNIVLGSAVTMTWSQVAAGGGKPADNATVGATWGVNMAPPARFGDSPGTAGLYVTASDFGFWNGSAWKSYMDSSGHFYLAGSGSHSLTWDGATLDIVGAITATSGTFRSASSGTRVEIGIDGLSYVTWYSSVGKSGYIYGLTDSLIVTSLSALRLYSGTDDIEITAGSGKNIVLNASIGAGGVIGLWGNSLSFNSNVIWHAGNDGSGSGLDADKLDGSHASAFSLTSHDHAGVYSPVGHTHSSYDYSGPIAMITVVDGIVTGVS